MEPLPSREARRARRTPIEPPTGGRARNEVVDGYGTEKMPSHAARVRDERGFGRFPIIDADAHHCESESNAEVADDDPRAAAKTAERILGAVERSGDFPAS